MLVWVLVTTGSLMLTVGCAANSAPIVQTTLLSSVDLQRMTDEMAASLIAADLGSDLSEMVIVTDRVVNRTNHIMEQGEKELFLVNLRQHLMASKALSDRGARFVARPDELTPYTGAVPEGAGAEVGPSHALTATFRTLTNVDRFVREDAYVAAFQLTELQTSRIVWEDAYRVRYAVERGR